MQLGVHCLNARIGSDRVLLELERCEDQLRIWLNSSAANAEWFAKDPVGALRAARLGLQEDVLRELALVIRALTKKLAATA